MEINWIFAVCVAGIVLKNVVQLSFEWLDRKHAKATKGTVPANLADRVTPEAHAKSAEYTLEHNSLGIVERVFGLVAVLWVLFSGVLPWVYNATVAYFGIGAYWAQALAISLFGVVLGLLFWPFDWVATFKIEEKYGFNKMTPALWFADALKGIVLNLLMGVPLMIVVLWLAQEVANWWIWAWLVVVGYEVFVSWIYPNWIAPLFNKFTPLEEGSLRQRLLGLAQRCGLTFQKLLVMDGSRRSRHANAYFTGFGSSRRVVLYDTLLSQLDEAEVEGVLAHEIGHLKHRHILKGMILGAVLQFVGFALLGYLVAWEEFYAAFGFDIGNGVAGAFFILSYVSGAFTFWLTPIFSAWSRKHEYEADRMASDLVGGPMPLVLALRKMTKESLASVEDHPLTHKFYASHPNLEEREKALGLKSAQ